MLAFLHSLDYREIEDEPFEPDLDAKEFVHDITVGELMESRNINNWTNKMLGDKMSDPFFRHSMFDNYTIGGRRKMKARQQPDLLTPQENYVLSHLADAWNEFCRLPILHKDDANEFKEAIHRAQNIIMSRPVLRRKDEQSGQIF